MKIIIPGNPATKKNSPMICKRKDGGRFVKPSKRFEDYQEMAGYYIPQKLRVKINSPVTVKCLYYRETRHRVDLTNLLEATCDILVHYGVLEDDNSRIAVSHDGSRVLYDKDNPRVEIEIMEVKHEENSLL